MATPAEQHWRRTRRATALFLSLWFATTFCSVYFARELDALAKGWPFSFWMAGQGVLLVYLGIVMAYVRWMSYLDQRLGLAP